MKGPFAILGTVALILVAYLDYERMLWNDCRHVHGVLYCVRTV